MKFVVDTNIVFSAVLNTQSKIGDLMMNSQGIFEFYACDTLRNELKRHRAVKAISTQIPQPYRHYPFEKS